MKNRLFCLIVSLCLTASLFAAVGSRGDTVTSAWFRDWYQWNDLRHYLDNNCDVAVYMSETTGEWAGSEPLLVSLGGNSYRWNRYYIDGFRVDSRATAGDALYMPDMFTHSMRIDPNRGAMYWQADALRPTHIRLSGQAGGVGGYSPSAKWLQELQEGNSAIKRIAKQETLNMRRHIVGSGSVDAVYTLPADGRRYTQHIYADYGVRRQLQYDYDGVMGTYDADYYKVQMDGQVPVAPTVPFDQLYYIFRAAYRADGFSEFGYNANEVSQQLNHSFSFYAHKDFGRQGFLTTGLTYAIQRNRHWDLSFTRNLIDLDGESLEPWYPDGHTHELSWAVNYRYPIRTWLQVHVDAYNSLMVFNPMQTQWTNTVSLQGYNMPAPLPLYDYEWQSQTFTSGLLENTFSIEADYPVLPWLRLKGVLSATLDGMLLANQPKVTPSWEAVADIHIEPVKWFKMNLTVGNYRIPYTYEQICFLSDSYMNGKVYYAGTNTLLTTTGGQYHRLKDRLVQPQYVSVDVPIIFTIGRHEISILSSFKKYYNTWSVRLAEESADSFEAVEQQQTSNDLSYSIYRMKPQERYYEIAAAPLTGTGVFNTPVYASNIIKYTYNGRKVFVSFSWQSYCLSGVSGMGNSMQMEDIQVLSESMANPNNVLVHTNTQQTSDGVRSLGRLHQDRAYIARLQLGVNITDNWQLSLSGKFRDGIPFRHYATYLDTDAAGRSQAVVWSMYTRGINVVDGNFGQRTDSFFNFDLRLKYRGAIRDVPFEVQALCYNVWDFATELNEYCMSYDGATGNGMSFNRTPLSLCTPRGLMLTVSVGLEKNKGLEP